MIALACFKDDDWPGVVVHATFMQIDMLDSGEYWVDWVEVTEMWRGTGYGQELLEGIENHYSIRLALDSDTVPGKNMIARMRPEGVLF